MKSRFRSADPSSSVDVKVPEVEDFDSYDDYMTIPLPTNNEVSTSLNSTNRFKNINKSDSSSSASNPLGKKRLNELMIDRRLEAMETPISESSKGFQLLSKFGYHGTGGLGKQGQGIADPLRVDQVADQRSGLGIHSNEGSHNREFKSVPLTSNKFKRNKLDAQFTDLATSYRSQQADRTIKKLITGDIKRAERVVRELDERCEIVQHSLWPTDHMLTDASTKLPQNDNLDCNDDDDSTFPRDRDDLSVIDVDDKVESRQLIAHTNDEIDDDNDVSDERKRYCQEEQVVESDDEFPVNTNISNTSATGSSVFIPNSSSSESDDEERLQTLLSYLRETHKYCLYCGCQYSSHEEMNDSCPGVLRDDH